MATTDDSIRALDDALQSARDALQSAREDLEDREDLLAGLGRMADPDWHESRAHWLGEHYVGYDDGQDRWVVTRRDYWLGVSYVATDVARGVVDGELYQALCDAIPADYSRIGSSRKALESLLEDAGPDAAAIAEWLGLDL